MVSLCNRPRITNSFTRLNHSSIFYIIFFIYRFSSIFLFCSSKVCPHSVSAGLAALYIHTIVTFSWPSRSIHTVATEFRRDRIHKGNNWDLRHRRYRLGQPDFFNFIFFSLSQKTRTETFKTITEHCFPVCGGLQQPHCPW